MTISSIHSSIVRLQKQIADLKKKDAQEARNEAQATAKANKARIEAGRAKTLSVLQSKSRQLDSSQKESANASSKRASIAKSISDKSAELLKAQAALSKEENSQRTKIEKEIKKHQTAVIRRQQEIEERATQQVGATRVPAEPDHEIFDVFISHASEDKEDFVEELAQKAEAAGLAVFYDNKSLQWGDSLRERIEHGLASSSFGVVVLSDAFFKKEWPKRELDGLFNLEIAGRSRILPIWHKISKDEVMKHAPSLSGKLALTTASLTVDEIVQKLVEIVRE
ncbi:TIR domain protein [Agrobacterium sp. DSM 25558]|uniref:toll/interleukin-1 receptor domain-containing protein n=1 Tax=Agrobacterium sp. DSM 25558 TaxID=1907665 RepID=UPI0009724CFF|nr:toll/interleukin-1 receptor domain-containing protein [Agrobacterium sp. DSM 25558]SCX26112.1 TIR domain protein [Agrobacterium sp. DSM 25558]